MKLCEIRVLLSIKAEIGPQQILLCMTVFCLDNQAEMPSHHFLMDLSIANDDLKLHHFLGVSTSQRVICDSKIQCVLLGKPNLHCNYTVTSIRILGDSF